MSKILITGATGFIGSHLLKYFLNKGYSIIAHGSSEMTIKTLIKTLKINNISLENVDFWSQDFLEPNWEFPNFSEIEYIIHTAAITKIREGVLENYDKYFGLNVIATKKLAEKAIKENVKHFVYFSSGQVFGIPPNFPFVEETPKNPINLYGFSKYMGELIIRSCGLFGLKFSIVRPFSVYGLGQQNIISIIKDKIIKDEVLTIYGDGSQSRAFTHINDICEAILTVFNNPNCFGEEYNLSGDKEYSVNKLVELISQRLKKTPKIEKRTSDVKELQRNIADTKKIKALGFNYKESLEDFINYELID